LADCPGKEGAENTLSNKVREEDFPTAGKAILDRTDRCQSNFAEKITGFRDRYGVDKGIIKRDIRNL
jgi:hypothetical protein